MTENLTDLPDLLEQYAAPDATHQYDMAALYATLEPLVDDGTLSPSTADDILDHAAALNNANAVLAEVETVRADAVRNATEREAKRVRVPRWVTVVEWPAFWVAFFIVQMCVALLAR